MAGADRLYRGMMSQIQAVELCGWETELENHQSAVDGGLGEGQRAYGHHEED